MWVTVTSQYLRLFAGGFSGLIHIQQNYMSVLPKDYSGDTVYYHAGGLDLRVTSEVLNLRVTEVWSITGHTFRLPDCL